MEFLVEKQPDIKHLSTATTLTDYTMNTVKGSIETVSIRFSCVKNESNKDIEAAEKEDPLATWKPRKQEWLIMISLSLLSLMVALDATILVSVLPTMATALHGTSIDAFWAGTSYLLSNAVLQPVIASVSEVFGRQQLLILSLSFFALGTILCAAAQDFTMLLAGRGIQGVGSAGIITLCQCIFCDIVPLRQRPKFFSIVLGSWAIGSIAGPVVGGAICQHWTWRGIFYINFPLCFIGFIMSFFLVKLRAVAPLSTTQKLLQTDWIGALLFVGSITSLLVGLSWGGIQYRWASIQTIGPLLIGLAGLGGFLVWQVKRAPFSLIRPSLFYCSSAFAAFYCAMINGLLLFTGLYYVPFYFMSVKGHSATRSGVDLVPALVFILPGSIIISLLTTQLGKFRWAIWIGWVITTLGSGLLFLLDTNTSVAVGVVPLFIFGIGSGMVLPSVNFAIQAISRVEDCAMSASMYGFFRSLGMPIGVAISGTVFQNAMSAKLVTLGLPSSIARESEGFVEVIHRLAPNDSTRILAIQAYSHRFRGIWIFMTVMSATGLIASLFIKRFSLDKLLHSNFTARRRSSIRQALGI